MIKIAQIQESHNLPLFIAQCAYRDARRAKPPTRATNRAKLHRQSGLNWIYYFSLCMCEGVGKGGTNTKERTNTACRHTLTLN